MAEPFSRRVLIQGGVAAALSTLIACQPAQSPRIETVRIGYQRDGVLLIAKQQGQIAGHLAATGIKNVEWAQFPSGPPLLEALSAGGIDLGGTGDTPPIFAQASGAYLVYVAAIPVRGLSSAILLPPGSPIMQISDLRGRRVAFTRGSSAHYFAISALRSAGLSLDDVVQVHLAPADARAAFMRGNVDAWLIWDPYFADAEHNAGARVLANARPFVHSASFLLASKAFAEANAAGLRALLDELRSVGRWVAKNQDIASSIISGATGLSPTITRITLARADFGLTPMSAAVVVRQQRIADEFTRLNIIPKPLKIADIVPEIGWR